MGAAIYERMEAAVYKICYKLDYADQELNGHIRLFSSRTMLNGATTEHEVYRQTMARLDDIFAKHKERRAAYKKKIAKFDEQLDRLDAVCQMDEAMEAASMPISGDVDMDEFHIPLSNVISVPASAAAVSTAKAGGGHNVAEAKQRAPATSIPSPVAP